MILQIISFPKFCINGNCFFYNFNHTKINQDSENEILWKYVVTRHIKKRDFKFKILKNTYSCCGPKNKHSLLGFVGFIPFFVFQSNWPKPKKSAVIFRQNKQDSWFFLFLVTLNKKRKMEWTKHLLLKVFENKSLYNLKKILHTSIWLFLNSIIFASFSVFCTGFQVRDIKVNKCFLIVLFSLKIDCRLVKFIQVITFLLECKQWPIFL